MSARSTQRRRLARGVGLLLCAAAVSTVGGVVADRPVAQAAATSCSDLEIIAHRGYHQGKIDENTLAAFAEATRLGYSIESDVWRDADGQLWVFHDRDVARATGSVGFIDEMSTAQVAALRYTKGGGALPTFQEAVALWAQHPDIRVYLEPKDNNVALATAHLLQEAGLSATVVYTAYQDKIAEKFPDFELLKRAGSNPPPPEKYSSDGTDYVSFPPNEITADLVGAFHAAGVQIQSQTKNNTLSWRQAIASGVDGMLVDDVDGLAAFCPAALALPIVSSFTPGDGARGTTVVITGSDFVDVSAVRFGNAAASDVNVVSPETIEVTVPSDAAASAQIRVTTPNGTAVSVERFVRPRTS